jgi:putative ABC transport system substrate-binding protein
MIDRRAFLAVTAAAALAGSRAAMGQGPRRVAVIGFLTLGGIDSLAQFRTALRELGYVEGTDVVIEPRSAEGNPDLLPRLAADLVGRNVDVLYVTGPAAVRVASAATSTIPIVALDLETDPVADGLVRSLGRPGGNLTGLFLDVPGLAGKWLELLREAVPGRRRVAVLWDSSAGASQLKAARVAAPRVGLELAVHEIRGYRDLDAALAATIDGGAQALLLLSSPVISVNSQQIAAFTRRHRLPAISPFRAFADNGGLMSYGPNLLEFRRFSATYVDRILKGAKPGDLPIQQPLKFELVVNATTARAFGLALPQALLLRADEVIQ